MRYLLLLLLLLLLTGCASQQLFEAAPFSTQIITDSEVYHSNEIMHLNVRIDSPVAVENATIRIHGIYLNKDRIDEFLTSDLKKGENFVSLDYKTPNNFECTGIRPDMYEIKADIISKGEVITSSKKEIEIRQ